VPYHHGNLRESLIDAAVEIAATAGPDAVALREVARHVGVSHNPAYRHFADREELMRAVAARAMTVFGRLMAERIASAATGRSKAAAYERLAACGRAYVEFATTQPGLFRTACSFALGSIEPDEDVVHPYAQLLERLDELVTTKRTLDLAQLLSEDSTFYGDLFAHVVQWRDTMYLEDGLHRAVRAALAQRPVLHARVLVLAD